MFDKVPKVHEDVFVAPSASVIGDIEVGTDPRFGMDAFREQFNFLLLMGEKLPCICKWSGSYGQFVIMTSFFCGRFAFSFCDVNSIRVGTGTNIQDHSLVHVAKSNLSGKVLPTIIGDNVTVGHSAVLHGCTVEDEAFVGMGAVLLDRVVVEKHGMVAGGALVRQNTKIPSGEVWGGNPAKVLKKLSEEEIAFISQSAANYCNLARAHAVENAKPFDEIEFEKMLRKKFARRDEEYGSLGVDRP
ncbi:unnamed protein product [Musa acuminata subsp. malaccensis]|uniref:(wild Malaysian banana) hypothetical protein n=1 Tax=Musa acuminata subsp. malaccensis TaxID=214687 RepID=A0A804HYZ9_MUSAM|nr:unnamed protein product [Musa acuminata subsp. malaccensis]